MRFWTNFAERFMGHEAWVRSMQKHHILVHNLRKVGMFTLNMKSGYIKNVIIYKNHRGKGHFSKLVALMREKGKEYNLPGIWLHSENNLVPLYTKHGFIHVKEVRVSDFVNGDDTGAILIIPLFME